MRSKWCFIFSKLCYLKLSSSVTRFDESLLLWQKFTSLWQIYDGLFLFFKMGRSRPLFLYFRLFNAVESKQMFNMNFINDWIRTADVWYQKRLLFQLSHNSTKVYFLFGKIINILWQICCIAGLIFIVVNGHLVTLRPQLSTYSSSAGILQFTKTT